MKIAVVILNWNGKELLKKFLPSVVENSQEATVYLADNASTDDSIAFVKAHYPNVVIIENLENGGYAKGYNDALKFVDEDIYCLLNSDVEVTKEWLKPIFSAFETTTDTAIIQPKILDYKNKSHFEYAGAAGGFIDKYGYPYCRGRIFDTVEEDTNQYQDSEIFWASGACFFIKKDVFRTLDGFDESFFAHMEEIDLCWRAFNLGMLTMYCNDSTVYHVGGATLKTNNPKKTYLNFRNSLFALTKNASEPLFLLIFIRLLLDGIASFKFLTQLKFAHMLSILRAHLSFYSNLTRLLKQRKILPKQKKYYHRTSIVWDYFIKNRNKFTDVGK